eukprot:scaffold97849_cov31-Attheya_sp.AAC.1
MSSVPQPQHNSQMDALIEAASQRRNLLTTTDGEEKHDDSLVTDDNLESQRSNNPTGTVVETHDDSIGTEDNLESAQQQCSHSTSSSTPTAKATETLLSCNRRVHNIDSGQRERCGKMPV